MSDAWHRRIIELYRRGLRRVETEVESTYRLGLTTLLNSNQELGWVLGRREILERLRGTAEIAVRAMDILERRA